MKKIFHFTFLITVLIIFTQCSNDEPEDNTIELRYDQENFSAPTLPASFYEAAIMFPSNFDGNDSENKITSISYYIADKPQTARLKLYIGGIASPDSIIYNQNIINEIDGNSFNTHFLTDSIELSGNDNLWVGIEFNQENAEAIIGCDVGPAQTNGDWLYDAADEMFTPLKNRGPVDINWNIRVNVELTE